MPLHVMLCQHAVLTEFALAALNVLTWLSTATYALDHICCGPTQANIQQACARLILTVRSQASLRAK